MKAMILAAGRGNRMRPLSDNIPKPLLKVGKFSLLEHLLLRLRAEGFQEIVINVAHLAEKIMTALGTGNRYGIKIEYSREHCEGGLETGGGIFNALPLLGQDPFIVVSGDLWTNYHFSTLRTKHLNASAHLVLVDNFPDHPDGDYLLSGEKLSLGEGKRLTFGSIGLYHPDLFKNCEPGFFPLAPLLAEAITEGRVTGEYYQGNWVNVSTPEVLASLNDA